MGLSITHEKAFYLGKKLKEIDKTKLDDVVIWANGGNKELRSLYNSIIVKITASFHFKCMVDRIISRSHGVSNNESDRLYDTDDYIEFSDDELMALDYIRKNFNL